MREFTIQQNDSGQRLNKFLAKAVPRLSGGQMHKYLRSKRIKVNDARTEAGYRLCVGDRVQLYLNDDYFTAPDEGHAFLHIATPDLTIAYEDAHILIADKAPGMVVHADERGDQNTLLAHIQAYLYQSGGWNPHDAASFAPALCNRIDRNTGGLVIAAKTAEALRVMNEKIRAHEVQKRYVCVVHGALKPPCGVLTHYLRRDEVRKQVSVHQRRIPGAKTAVTYYRTLAHDGKLSLVECELLTGRTHQIRAQFSAVGCPLLGDGKYGTGAQNRPYGMRGQALYAYAVRFCFTEGAGALSYLGGLQVRAARVPFVAQYFPTVHLDRLGEWDSDGGRRRKELSFLYERGQF